MNAKVWAVAAIVPDRPGWSCRAPTAEAGVHAETRADVLKGIDGHIVSKAVMGGRFHR
jgi:hypothetical protein